MYLSDLRHKDNWFKGQVIKHRIFIKYILIDLTSNFTVCISLYRYAVN